jgi:hypothetical protein
MLREGNALPYYEDDKVQTMPLGFTSGGSMYIIGNGAWYGRHFSRPVGTNKTL